MAVVIILSAIVFIGGLLTVLKAGSKDGICKYDYNKYDFDD